MKTSSLAITPYMELTKPRIVFLVLVTATFGYFLAGEHASFGHLLFFLIGFALVSAGSSSLNHFLEREADAKMDRTKNRPLPAKQIEPDAAFSFGIFLLLTGLFVLFLYSNLLTTFLSLLAAFLYIIVYTPMKKVSWLNTFVGAIPGAIPPMAGWTAASPRLDAGAWVLFGILFLWQMPHFFAIAWMFREDYAKAGFRMLSVIDSDGKKIFRLSLLFSLLLIPVSLLPTPLTITGEIYFVGTLILGIWFFLVNVRWNQSHSAADAKKVLKASILYLPILLILILIDSQIFSFLAS